MKSMPQWLLGDTEISLEPRKMPGGWILHASCSFGDELPLFDRILDLGLLHEPRSWKRNKKK